MLENFYTKKNFSYFLARDLQYAKEQILHF